VEYTRSALYAATHNVFIALLVVAVLGLFMQFLVPHRVQPLVFADDAVPQHKLGAAD
jgi:hypothetical protein